MREPLLRVMVPSTQKKKQSIHRHISVHDERGKETRAAGRRDGGGGGDMELNGDTYTMSTADRSAVGRLRSCAEDIIVCTQAAARRLLCCLLKVS